MLAAEERPLVIKDGLSGVNPFPAAFSFDHRIDEAFEFFTRPAIDAKPMQWVRMHEANFGGNSARQTGLEHGPRFGQRIGTNHSGDMQADFRVTKIIKLRQDRLERFFRNWTRCHPINADLHDLEAGIFQFREKLTSEEKTVRRYAGGNAQVAAVANELDNTRMHKRLGADESEPHGA